jgi:hypothetical protein
MDQQNARLETRLVQAWEDLPLRRGQIDYRRVAIVHGQGARVMLCRRDDGTTTIEED